MASAKGAPAAPVVHDGPSAPVIAWRKAMEVADLDALEKMHGPATIGFPPGRMLLRGGDAIMQDYKGLFAKYEARVVFEDTHWVEQTPLVASWGLYTLTLHPKAGGDDVVTNGRFSDVAIAVDGGWRYLVDHASVPTTSR